MPVCKQETPPGRDDADGNSWAFIQSGKLPFRFTGVSTNGCDISSRAILIAIGLWRSEA
jgi:hypothetical protein